MGIGIDRIIMMLTGQDSIREIILFPTLKNWKKKKLPRPNNAGALPALDIKRPR